MTNEETGFWLIFVTVSSIVIIGIFFLIGVVIHAFVPLPHRPKYGVYDVRDYKTSEWQLLKGYVLQREKDKCQYCGSTAQTAHHLSYRQGIICNPRLLQAVCWQCHNRIHSKQMQETSIPMDELLEYELTDWEIEQLADRGEKQL